MIHEVDDESAYLFMGYLAEWLCDARPEDVTPQILARVQEFALWCEEQPSGATAGDDALTILVVAFYEKLFSREHTRAILPRLIPKADFERNADYLKTWVGEENYSKASHYYAQTA